MSTRTKEFTFWYDLGRGMREVICSYRAFTIEEALEDALEDGYEFLWYEFAKEYKYNDKPVKMSEVAI